jgi:hypothetical protein
VKALALLAILALPARAETWFTCRAGNFIVFTNADAARAVRTAETLERMRAAAAATTNLNATVADPIRVFVFRSTKDYLRYGRAAIGSAPRKDALSVIHPEAKAIFLDATALRGDVLLQHELAHHLVRQTFGRLPLWLDEGLAEFYSTMRVRGDVVQVGRARDVHRRLMRRTMVPMRDLVGADPTSRWYSEPFLENRFYAQSWLFTHWLVVYRGADIRAVAGEFAQHDGETAIRNLFQMTPMQLQRTIYRYNFLPALPSRTTKIETLEVAPVQEPRTMTPQEIEAMFLW